MAPHPTRAHGHLQRHTDMCIHHVSKHTQTPHIHKHTHTHAHRQTHTHTHEHTQRQIAHIHIPMCMLTHTHIHMHTHTHTHTNIHSVRHTHTHSVTHTHTHTPLLVIGVVEDIRKKKTNQYDLIALLFAFFIFQRIFTLSVLPLALDSGEGALWL